MIAGQDFHVEKALIRSKICRAICIIIQIVQTLTRTRLVLLQHRYLDSGRELATTGKGSRSNDNGHCRGWCLYRHFRPKR